MTACLVVGGGFLGSHVATRLVDEGHDVVVYSRSFGGALRAVGRDMKVRLVEGEVPPGPGLTELVAEAEIVFYLSGSSSPAVAHHDPGGSVSAYVVPATAVLDVMRATSTRRVVIASSGGTVYGAVSQVPTTEEHPTRPISLHGHHSLTVERYALFFGERYGFEPVILRYANPYGPGQLVRRGQGVIASWFEALAEGREIVVYGDPRTRRDFIYAQDAAAATTAAAFDAPANSIYNVGSGQSHTLGAVLPLLMSVAERTTSVRHVAPREVDVPVTQLDTARLRACTGWTPVVPFEAGLRQTWQWISGVDTSLWSSELSRRTVMPER